MLQINFNNLIKNHPDLKEVWVFLDKWIKLHQTVKFISVSRLATDNLDISAVDLVEAIHILLSEGLIDRVYQAKDSYGIILERTFNSTEEILDYLKDIKVIAGFIIKE